MAEKLPHTQAVGAPGLVLRQMRWHLEPDDGERVRAGMELMQWDCASELWQLHIDACAQFNAEAAPVKSRRLHGAMGAVAGASLGGMCGIGLGVIGVAVAGAIGAAIGFAGAAGLVVASDRRLPVRASRIRTELRVQSPPSVLLTSTGVRFGELSRAWRGRIAALADASVVNGLPPYLVLQFDPPDGLAFHNEAHFSLYLPVPSTLLDDVRDLARMLGERWKRKGLRPDALVARGNGSAADR